MWGGEWTGTGSTHCRWSSAVLCWTDQGFQVPRSGTPISWIICACPRPSPVCKTPLGTSSCYQLDPMTDTHPVTQANCGHPVGLQGASNTSPLQAPLGPQTSVASGSTYRCQLSQSVPTSPGGGTLLRMLIETGVCRTEHLRIDAEVKEVLSKSPQAA